MFRRFAIVVMILVSSGIVTNAVEPQESEAFKNLAASKREEFQREYGSLKETRDHLDQLKEKASQAAPLLPKVKKLRAQVASQSSELGVEKIPGIGQKFRTQGKSDAFNGWLKLEKRDADAVVADELFKDQELRQVLVGVARTSLDRILASDKRPDNWDIMDGLLPKGSTNTQSLSDDQVGRAWVNWLKAKADLNRGERQQLQASLGIDQADAQTVKTWSQASARSNYLGHFIARNETQDIELAAAKVRDVYGRLNRIWPGWTEALREGIYTPMEEPRTEAIPATVGSFRWSKLVAVNLAVVVAILAYWGYRSRATHVSGLNSDV